MYLILDVYNRKIVGFEVHDSDDADHAAHLVKRTALAEGIHAMTVKPVLHGDNGSTLNAGTIRNWTPIGAVTLNPERDSVVKTHSARGDIQPLSA